MLEKVLDITRNTLNNMTFAWKKPPIQRKTITHSKPDSHQGKMVMGLAATAYLISFN